MVKINDISALTLQLPSTIFQKEQPLHKPTF